MPCGSKAPLPTASLCAGTPNSTTARTPRAGQLGDLLAQALAAVLDDAGQRHDRLRLGDVLAHEQRGDEVARAHGRLGDEVTQGRRAAQAAGPVDGEGSTGHRRHGMTRASRSDTEEASGDVADVGDVRPRAAASDAVTGPMAISSGDGDVAERVGQRRGGRAAGQQHGIGARQRRHLVGRRAAGDRPVGDDGLDGVAARGEAVGQRAPGPVGLGEEDPGRLRAGTRRAGPRREPSAGTRSTSRPAAAASAAAVAGPTAARRNAGWPAAAGPARARAVGRRDDQPVERRQPGQRGPQLHAAVGRIADLDQRHVHDRRPHAARRAPSSPVLGPGDGDPLAGQRRAHAQPPRHLGAIAATGPSGRVPRRPPSGCVPRRPAARQGTRPDRHARAAHQPTTRRAWWAASRARSWSPASRARAMRSWAVSSWPARNTCSSWPTDVGADRQRAARTELGEEAALDLDLVAGGGVVDGGQQLRPSPSRRRGSRRRRSPARRPARSGADRGARRSARSSRAPAARRRPSRSHRLGWNLRQPGGDVPAQLDEREIGPRRGELRPPAHRPGGDGGARGERGERSTDQGVGRDRAGR